MSIARARLSFRRPFRLLPADRRLWYLSAIPRASLSTAQPILNHGQRSHHPGARTAVKHGLDGSSERLDIDAERHARVILPKPLALLVDRVDRLEDADHHGHFRLQTIRHALRPRLQQ